MNNTFPGPAVAISATGVQLAQGPPGPAGPAGPIGPQGPVGTGIAGGVPVFFAAGLASVTITGSRATQNVDGYSVQNDGGQGVFWWNAIDNRASPTGASGVAAGSDGGTYIPGPLGAGVAGRWNRILDTGNVYNVKHFGARGDGSADDTVAIQNAIVSAYFNQQAVTISGFAFFSLPAIYFPAGIYKLSAELQCNGYIRFFSDQQAILFTSSTTNNILRSGVPQLICECISFEGGRSAIIYGGAGNSSLWGPGAVLGNYAAGGVSSFTSCQFVNQAGPSLMTDTTQVSQQRTVSSQGQFENCFWQTPCGFFGAWDRLRFQNCWAGANDVVVPAPVDGAGRTLGFFNVADQCTIDGFVGTPQYTTAVLPVWIRGSSHLEAIDCQFGGEGVMGIFETSYTTAITYNGSTLFVDPSAVPQIIAERCAFSSAVGVEWLRCRDTFPQKIIIRSPLAAVTGVMSTPPQMQDFYGSTGIWVDSAIDMTAVSARPDVVIRIDDAAIDAGALRFHQSSAPGVFGVDVSAALAPAIAAGTESVYGPNRSAPADGIHENNLFFSGSTDLSGATWSITSGNAGATGGHFTSTGYSLSEYRATGDNGYVYFITTASWHPAVAAGVYCFSFVLADCNIGGEVLVGVGPANTPVGMRSRRYAASGAEQRITFPFYYDGTTPLYFSIQFPSLSHFLSDGSTQTRFGGGLTMINRGPLAAAYVQPVDNAASPTTNTTSAAVVSVYRGTSTTPPATGAYNVGDQYWNIAATAGQVKCWVCTQSSPLTWDPVDEGSMPVRTATGASDTVLVSDCAILYNHAGAIAVTLPLFPNGRHFRFKDISGAATTNHITITPSSGTIDGASSYVLNQNYGEVETISDGTNWWVI